LDEIGVNLPQGNEWPRLFAAARAEL
jgi:hypothetical protein